jgi:hypothetical protein
VLERSDLHVQLQAALDELAREPGDETLALGERHGEALECA